MIKLVKKIPKPIVLAVAVPVGAAVLEWAAKKNRARHPEQTQDKISDLLDKGSNALRHLR
jgi:hypothetical protein